MSTLDPATGNDSRVSSSKSTTEKGKVPMISRIYLDGREGNLQQGHMGWLGRFSPLNTPERSHSETMDRFEAHISLDN